MNLPPGDQDGSLASPERLVRLLSVVPPGLIEWMPRTPGGRTGKQSALSWTSLENGSTDFRSLRSQPGKDQSPGLFEPDKPGTDQNGWKQM
jgi:hypothetical protein